MAEIGTPSPFARLFNPDNPSGSPFGNMMGAIGNMAGVSTGADRAGTARSMAMEKLSTLMQENGGNPQQAFLKFMQMPEGRDMFISDPNLNETINQFFANAVHKPTTVTTGPGAMTQATTPTGGFTTIANQPGANQQPGFDNLAPGGLMVFRNPDGSIREVTRNPTTEQQNQNLPKDNVVPPNNTLTRTEGGKTSPLYQAPSAPMSVGPGAGVIQPGQPNASFTQPTTDQQNANLPKQTVVGPAQRLVQTTPDGGTKEIYRAPTTGTQSFFEMNDIAKLPQDALQEIAAVQMLPENQRPTQQERAVKGLLARGAINENQGQMLLSGAYEVQPVRDAFGAVVGSFIVNKLTNEAIQSGGRIGGPNLPGNTPPQPTNPQIQIKPGAQKSDGSIDPQVQFAEDQRSMFLGTGLLPNAVSMLGSVLGQADPRLEPDASLKVKGQQAHIRNLHNSLYGLRDNAQGLGIPMKVIDSVIALAPGLGYFETVPAAVRDGMRLKQIVGNEIAANEATIADRYQSDNERTSASKRLESWRKVDRALPSMASMVELYDNVKEGTAGAMTLESGYNTVKDSLTKTRDRLQQGDTTGKGPQYETMGEADIRKIDLKKLPPADFDRVLKRLDALLGKSK